MMALSDVAASLDDVADEVAKLPLPDAVVVIGHQGLVGPAEAQQVDGKNPVACLHKRGYVGPPVVGRCAKAMSNIPSRSAGM